MVTGSITERVFFHHPVIVSYCYYRLQILESKAVEQWQKYSSADIIEILRWVLTRYFTLVAKENRHRFTTGLFQSTKISWITGTSEADEQSLRDLVEWLVVLGLWICLCSFRVLVDMKYDSISPSFLKMISSWLAFHIHQVLPSSPSSAGVRDRGVT